MRPFVSLCNKLKLNQGELTLGAIYSTVTSDKRTIQFPSFVRNSDEWRTREVEAGDFVPFISPPSAGEKLSLSRQVGAHLAALHLERQRED